MPRTRKWLQWSRSFRKDSLYAAMVKVLQERYALRDATGAEIPGVSFDPEIAVPHSVVERTIRRIKTWTGTRSNMPAIDHVNRGTVELIRSFLRCNIALNRKTHSLHFSKIKQTPTGNHCFGAAKILRILCSGSFSGLDHQPDEFEVQMRRHVLCSDPLDSALHFWSIYQVICVLHSPERFGGIKYGINSYNLLNCIAYALSFHFLLCLYGRVVDLGLGGGTSK